MKQIRDRLQNGETPQDLIKAGFKRTTVYSINKKMEVKTEENNDVKSKEQSMEHLTFLAFIIKETMGTIYGDLDRKHDSVDELPTWQSIVRIASSLYEESMGKKPPKDFLNPTLKQPE
jgi:hypothetical protein